MARSVWPCSRQSPRIPTRCFCASLLLLGCVGDSDSSPLPQDLLSLSGFWPPALLPAVVVSWSGGPEDLGAPGASDSLECYNKLRSLFYCGERLYAEYACSNDGFLQYLSTIVPLQCMDTPSCQSFCYSILQDLPMLESSLGSERDPERDPSSSTCTEKEQLMETFSGSPKVVIENEYNEADDIWKPMMRWGDEPPPVARNETHDATHRGHLVSYLGDPMSCIMGKDMAYCLIDSPVYRQGLCRPAACTGDDIEKWDKNVLKLTGPNALRGMNFTDVVFNVSCRKFGDPAVVALVKWTQADFASLLVVLSLCGLVVAGTACDVCERSRKTTRATPGDGGANADGRVFNADGRMFGVVEDRREDAGERTPSGDRGGSRSRGSGDLFDLHHPDRSGESTPDVRHGSRGRSDAAREGPMAKYGYGRDSYVGWSLGPNPWARRDLTNVIQRWSIAANCPSLSKRRVEIQGTSIATLDGIRSIALLGVMLLDSFIAPMDTVGYEVPQTVYPPAGVMSKPAWQFVAAGWLHVDTLLWIGGFLATAQIVPLVRQNPQLLTWEGFLFRLYPIMVLSQWIQLAVPLAFVCMISTTWFKAAGSGILWTASCISSVSGPACDDWWWRRVLFVDNLIPKKSAAAETCLPHMWLPMVEMQLFLLLPILVLVREKWGCKVGHACCWTLVAGSMAVTGLLLYTRSAMSDPFLGGKDFWEEFHTQPWCRSQPYFIGVSCCWLHEKLPTWQWNRAKAARDAEDQSLKWSLADALDVVTTTTNNLVTTGAYGPYGRMRAPFGSAAVAWLIQISCLCIMAVLGFVPYLRYQCGSQSYSDCFKFSTQGFEGSPWSPAANAVYGAVNRTIWTFVVATLALMSSFRVPSTWLPNKLLTGMFWRGASDLCYSAYLVHPLVLVYILCETGTTINFSWIALVVCFTASAIGAFLFSFVIWLLLERPVSTLAMTLVGRCTAPML